MCVSIVGSRGTVSSVLASGHVEQDGKGCVSVLWAAEGLYPAFWPLAMLSRMERDVCQYFGQQELCQRFGLWPQ